MHATASRTRRFMPILLAALLALCLAPAVAHADVTTITVTFDSNGGSAVPAQTDVLVGGLVATPTPDPTKTGSTFIGWYSDPGLTTLWVFALDPAPAADLTLYAGWMVDQYQVAFDSNGGSAIPTQTVAYGELVATPTPDPVRTGYTFVGWYSDPGLTTPWDFSVNTMGAGDMTLYAKWTVNSYEVSFNSSGGSAVPTQTLEFGALIAEPTPPTRTGYTFTGWYADPGLTTLWDFSATTVPAHDITLFAKWTVNEYQVSFDSNGGSAVATQTIAYGALVAEPAPPTRTGYTFAGWYADPGFSLPWNFSAYVVGAGDMTLYAKWTVNEYQVSFDSNGGSAVATQTIAYGALVTVPEPVPTRTGYTFAGWYVDPGLTTLWDFSAGTVPAADITLYAKWTLNSYQVSFDSNGGTAVATVTLDFGSLVAEPTPPTRTGYTFAGWYADAGLTTPWNFASDTVPANDITLHAKWTVNQYQVAFDSNGGTAVATVTLDFGTLVAEPTAPTLTGYTFAGWYTDAGLTTAWNFASDTVPASNITLYAKWTINGYQVSFDSNGGSAVATQAVPFGGLATSPTPDPTRTGYTFAGWFADAGLTTPWDFAVDTVPANDITLHAKWTVNQYQVAFDSNGGTSVATVTLDFGTLVTEPTSPDRAGYTFAGWYSDAGLITPWDFVVDTVPAADTTLYAKWTINTYQVSFASNGGSAVPTVTLDFGSIVATPDPAPTRTDYAFAGWYSDAGLTTPWDFSAGTVPASDMTLYAKWTRVYKITGVAGSNGSLSIGASATVPVNGSLTVTITPAAGWGIASVVVDGASKGTPKTYTFTNVTANHTISVTFKRVTSTTLTASASSITRNHYVTLYGRVKSNVPSYVNVYLRFEVKLPGSSRWILLKNVKLSSSGRASYRYQVLNRGTRYHRVRFLGTKSMLPAPLKPGLALKVR